MWQRVQFKLTVLVFQCLSGSAPTYLSDDSQLIADISMHRLCSIDTMMCAIRRSHNTFGDRRFAIALPWLWNSLPSQMDSVIVSESSDSCWRHICSGTMALRDILVESAFRNHLTYLLRWRSDMGYVIIITSANFLSACRCLSSQKFHCKLYTQSNGHWPTFGGLHIHSL